MPRRQRVDSIKAHQVIAAESVKTIAPPAHLPLEIDDMPFWNSVLGEFARSEWTAHQLELAAMLARTMSDVERNQRLLRSEGEVVVTERGQPVPNSRLAALRMQMTNVLAYRRSLGVHARAKDGEARDVGKRRAQTKAVEAEVTAGLDDFIARPTVN